MIDILNSYYPIKREDLELIANLEPYKRVAILRPEKDDTIKVLIKKYQLWKIYHFDFYVFCDFPAYQKISDNFKANITQRNLTDYLEAGFGGCGKTTDFESYHTYRAVYGITKWTIYQSAVIENVNNFNTNIINRLELDSMLQDYGKLVPDELRGKTVKEKKKRMNVHKLDLTNGTSFSSLPSSRSIRGVKSPHGDNKKPDTIQLDDLMTSKIAESEAHKRATLRNVFEAKRSIDQAIGVVIFTSNITEGGGITQDMIEAKECPYLVVPATRPVRVYNGESEVLIPQKKGLTNWPDKWVMTREEMIEKNKNQTNPDMLVSCIEDAKERFGSKYKYEFECELFDRKDRLFNNIKDVTSKPMKVIDSYGVNVKYYKDYDDDLAYTIGVDPASGKNRDPSTIVVINEKKEVCAFFKDNNTTLDVLAKIICEVAERYDCPIVAVENNGLGEGLIAILKDIYDGELYRKEVVDKVNNTVSNSYGFYTGIKTKEQLIRAISDSIKNKELFVYDKELHSQLSIMTYEDFDKRRLDLDHHFDGVIALGIALIVMESQKEDYVSYDIV